MHIRQFRPLIPASPETASKLIVPPYDVLTPSEALHLHAVNPHSLLPVTLPKIITPSSPYKSAVSTLSSLADTSYTRPSSPTVYVYAQTTASHSQAGLVALSSIEDYIQDRIKKHEHTRPDKENERRELTDALSAHVGPVFLAYRDVPAIDEIVRQAMSENPLFDVTQEEVRHRVWPISEDMATDLVSLFDKRVPSAYIADGHHRAASAVSVGSRRRESLEEGAPLQDSDFFLSVLFPASQLRIMAYNRVVKDLNGRSEEEFIDELRSVGSVKKMDEEPEHMPYKKRMVYVYCGDNWYEMMLPQEEGNSAVHGVDAGILQKHVLGPLLGIENPRKSKRIEFVGGVKGIAGLKKRVDAGGVAFAMCAVTVDRLMKVSDEGEVMPPKSTWFEPKLRSGFFIHTF